MSVSPLGAIGVGLGAGVICYGAVSMLKPALGYDDSLDVFGVHGVGGMWGALATALFISSEWGLQDGVSQGEQILIQLKSIGFTAVFAIGATVAILSILKIVLGGSLRVYEDSEMQGLDLVEHSETAYTS